MIYTLNNVTAVKYVQSLSIVTTGNNYLVCQMRVEITVLLSSESVLYNTCESNTFQLQVEGYQQIIY